MGLLSAGKPLSWQETRQLAEHVKRHGIKQFIAQYHKVKGRIGDTLKWGDEVEYMVLHLDPATRSVRVSTRATAILEALQRKELELGAEGVDSLWRPEYAAYMVEGTPGSPYGGLMSHFNVVEANMKRRREEVEQELEPGEILVSLTCFPRLGCPDFTWPPSRPTPDAGASRSLFFPEEAIFGGHPRFATLTRNIRERRGEKVAINVPIFRDVATPNPFVEDLASLGDDGESARAALPDHIYMDCMGFGMGCSCLQVTFQACCIDEAKTLYDQLAPMCPVMLALSAASPIYRGRLADVDCRWDVVSASVDCRTRAERGLAPREPGGFRIPKSRYSSIDCYVSPEGAEYNDGEVLYESWAYEELRAAGLDHLLAQHVAHLFVRDPVSLFEEKIHVDDDTETEHFENINSTNWQTMRFKLPPPGSSIGWRVEFRPCDLQLTDFENAAYTAFIVLLTRVILSLKLNLLVPISKVDENMARCQKRDAIHTQKFWFRSDLLRADAAGKCSDAMRQMQQAQPVQQAECVEMTIDEIVNGKPGGFTGLIPLIHSYLSSVEIDTDTHCSIQQYLKLIRSRASGEVMTAASWMRRFVRSHPDYKNDSVVSGLIAYDLIREIHLISQGQRKCTELLGNLPKRSRTAGDIPTAVRKVSELYASRNPE